MTRIQSRIFTANIFSAMTGPTLAVALRDHYHFSNQYLLNSNVNYCLQFNDFFMFSSVMMLGAILCNSRITEIGKIYAEQKNERELTTVEIIEKMNRFKVLESDLEKLREL